MMDSFESQFKKNKKNSLRLLEVNLVRDNISQLQTRLHFLKTEKYEGSKWTMHA